MEFNLSEIELIKNTVAKGATDDELQMFLYLAKEYNLDPFKKEIWFVKLNGITSIMTSRDGYLKYAQMNEDFQGLMSFVVKEGDVFEIDASEYKIHHRFGPNRGAVLGAWARCDRKEKNPFIAYVEFSEYNKDTNIWRNYPSAMIQKVAEVFVLKRAFGINGLVTKEEIGDIEAEPGVVEENKPQTITRAQQKRMFAISEGNQEIVRQAINEYGFTSTGDVTKEIYNKICSRIEELIAKFNEIKDVQYPWDTES